MSNKNLNYRNVNVEKLFQDFRLSIRSEQIKMIKEVRNSLIENKTLVIEAPTATGKSFAYLIGALFFNEERLLKKKQKKSIIISTATIALQEQLIYKDLPFIKKLMKNYKIKFNYKWAKGRSNYLCLSKLEFLTDKNKNLRIKKEIDFLKNNLNKNWNGDFNLLERKISKKINNKIYNDSHSCYFKKCYFYEKCPFFNARKRLRKIDIIIINHNLLISHLNLGDGSILPKFKDSIYINDVNKIVNNLPDKILDIIDYKKFKKISSYVINIIKQLYSNIDSIYSKKLNEKEIFYINNNEIIELGTIIKKNILYFISNLEKIRTTITLDIKKNITYIINIQELEKNA